MTATKAFEQSVKAVSRQLSRWEIGVDGAIHACAILAGIAGTVALILIASTRGGSAAVASAAIYSAGLLVMFGCSAAYNLGQWSRHRLLLRNLDQAGIFLMIAGTYTPFTVLHFEGAWSIGFTVLIWSMAVFGILARLLLDRLFDRISIALYLTLGWMSLVALAPLVRALDAPALILLAAGGVLYTIGVIFHLWEKLPFQTAIWHAFVVAAAAAHYAAIAVSIGPAPSPL